MRLLVSELVIQSVRIHRSNQMITFKSNALMIAVGTHQRPTQADMRVPFIRSSMRCARFDAKRRCFLACSSTESIQRFDYNSEDGPKAKATLENVFGPLHASQSVSDQESEPETDTVPWRMGFQLSERNLTMNDDLKLRLVKVGAFT